MEIQQYCRWDIGGRELPFFLFLGGTGRCLFSIRIFRGHPPQRTLIFQFLDASCFPSASNSLRVSHFPFLLFIHFCQMPCSIFFLYKTPSAGPHVTGSWGLWKSIFSTLGILGPLFLPFFRGPVLAVFFPLGLPLFFGALLLWVLGLPLFLSEKIKNIIKQMLLKSCIAYNSAFQNFHFTINFQEPTA